jgi:hypothetical protein
MACQRPWRSGRRKVSLKPVLSLSNGSHLKCLCTKPYPGLFSSDQPTFLRRKRREGDQQVQRAGWNNSRTYVRCQAPCGPYRLRPRFTLCAQMTFDSFDTKSLFCSSPLHTSSLPASRQQQRFATLEHNKNIMSSPFGLDGLTTPPEFLNSSII